jgi:hypothetical protein
MAIIWETCRIRERLGCFTEAVTEPCVVLGRYTEAVHLPRVMLCGCDDLRAARAFCGMCVWQDAVTEYPLKELLDRYGQQKNLFFQ